MTVEIKEQDQTASQATLHPQAGSGGKGDLMQKLVTAVQGMGVEDLSKFLEQSLALIGHEADGIPAGAAAANQATIVTKEELEAVFAGDSTITEETKTKFATLFEAAVVASTTGKVAILEAQLEDKYEAALKEEVAKITEQLDTYMSYAADEYMKSNAIAIDSELKVEITEEFMEGLKTLFKEHWIEMPEEKLDVLATVNEELEVTKSKLNETVNEVIELKKLIQSSSKDQVIRQVTEGLTLVDAEKLKTLSEDVSYNDPESYSAALKVIKEKFVLKPVSKDTGLLSESIIQEEERVIDPRVKKYVAALDKLKS